ncbi:MAG: methyltransferase domain-containing protein, partial [Gammaproteobacteria bacterium]
GMREAPRILDACVAPGGKLFHLAERFPQATLVGIELSRDRLAHVQQEAARLGHENVQLIGGDATGRDWLSKLAAGDGDAARFDLILLDAPCSGSGTLRRHPDIKLLRTEQDVSAAAELQLALLENLWPLLAEGGSLIYCTCSVFTEENDQVVEAFIRRLQQEAAPTLDRLDLPVGIATRFGWQLLPLPADETPPNRSVDGFYFARMTRREKAR